MASFSVLIGSSSSNPSRYQNHKPYSIPFPRKLCNGFLPDSPGILQFQRSSRSQFNILKVHAQLNEVTTEKFANSKSVSETKSEIVEPEENDKLGVPDASSISAFMAQVTDLIKLVDSRDIVELELKQSGCEVVIRKKQAFPEPPAASPIMMMQSPYPQTSVPPQLPSTPSPPASLLVQPTTAKPASKSSHPPLKCPMAGTFYRSPAPGAPSFVKVGDMVKKGQPICIIEAMKLMNEIEADQSGKIVEILVDDGKPVSLDTPLFVIEP
ncbi:Biotin carboxyl carrier protein of acetyl-CoA carboxylase [Quillaja saponaria]|uniref:Biotin carboxyl carrier protein of acetyl-CoA carboxylase n=1 Tax=Quillaja saponaria TaxID=32244 RepID=A0AAD7VKA3_QUISA|nr:Biotin carboxyl carrier protein of acetyl-CoA carboxylase [Quillaja saponaria]